MNTDTLEGIKTRKKLGTILDSMDIPEARKDMSFGSLMWLMRNIGFRNTNHPDIEEARSLIRILMRENER